ncbi:hypothetical protein CASFOL_019253 [Castilleja foliolosa]|uniref:Uncharacterized protein n=1 Tax=Castilleja foliolosa TaxID=1961234 RepID=A0ABD3D6W5_9LAMI
MAEAVLQLNVASMVEDVLQQHGKRLSDIDLASRKAQEASLRRYEAAEWLRKTAGVVAGKDLPAEPSEEDFRLGLRSGIILCNVINKVQPGAVSKVIEAPPVSVTIPDGAALTAYQYFENVRNFLVAIEEMGIPTFEASDLEQGGKSSRIVHCILALKSYNKWKQCGGNGLWKFSGNSNKPVSGGKQAVVRKNSDLNMKFISRYSVAGEKSVDGLSNEDNSSCVGGEDAQGLNESGISQSLHALVRELLSDKSREDIPLIVESMLSNVMEEIERRLASQTTTHVKDVPSSNRTEEMVATNVTQDEKCFEHEKQDEKCSSDITQDDEKRSTNITKDDKKCSTNVAEDNEKRSTNITQDDKKGSTNVTQEKRLSENKILVIAPTGYNSKLNHQQRSVQDLKNLLQTAKKEVQLLQMNYLDEVDNIGMNLSSIGKHMSTLAHAASGYKKVVEENRKLYNQIQDLKGSIRVYCRVRPFMPGETGGSSAVEDINDGSIAITTNAKFGKAKKQPFTFNRCFGPSSTQEEVFADTQPLIRSVLDGYNVCIFAYGQTGSGKTFTMTGPKELTKETLGVNYRALSDLFQISEQRKDMIAYDISVQMMEIYNEQVRDLLATDGGSKRLEIRNNSSNGINVPNANLVPVTSSADVINLMNLGHKNRAVGSTLMNDRSSRSHSCLTVHVQGKDMTSGSLLRGCMHLVDLAGSERLDKTEATGERLKEAQHINRSLSALGDVISSLALKQSHVPYRNSKLTQLLQDSLGGKAKTLMFVHISPDLDALGETLSTLKFAERVSTVELGAAKVNKDGSDVKELKEQVASLKAALARKEGGGETAYGSSPSQLSWDSIDDVCKTAGRSNSTSTSRRHSLDPQDLIANSPPWSNEEEKGVNENWDDKLMVSKANGGEPREIFYQKGMTHPERSPNKGSGTGSRRHSLDNGLARTTQYHEAVATDYSDDLEIATSDSSEADYQSQINMRKCNSMPNVAGPKGKKPSPKLTKGPETKSQIPQPTRRVSSPGQSPLQKTGRQMGPAAGRRKPINAK